jgi:GMP reductase
MRIIEEVKLDFSDVLIKPNRSTLASRNQVNLIKEFKPKYGIPFSGIPIMAANMATGTFDMLRTFSKHSMFVAIAKHHNNMWLEEYNKDKSILDYGFYTIGMSKWELDDLYDFNDDIDFDKRLKIVVDIANGYTQNFADFVGSVRDKFPENVIIAGNVATPEMTQELIIAGADYVKVGIGPGSVCSTRRMTGIGYPQLSAIIECADAAHGLGGGIIGDGGIRTPGDASKALCANADMVMIGGMFAGTDECDGEITEKTFETGELYWDNGEYVKSAEMKQFKKFYGMSSEYAQETHGAGKKEYRASEGVVSEVPYVGSVEPIVKELLGGIRSTGTYIGADHIKNFGKCATFIKVNRIHDRNT